ncbi:MAG: DUF6161 domain-containing protein [Candidatus Thiodiazotropha sp.]
MQQTIKLAVKDATDQLWEFTNLAELKEFLNTEIEFWKGKYEGFESTKIQEIHQHFTSYTHISRIVTAIDDLEKEASELDEKVYVNRINQINEQLRGLRAIWLWSGQPYTETFYKCNLKYNLKVTTAFIDFLIKKQCANLNEQDYLIGVLLGYEFLMQDSDITKRSVSERESLSRLREALSSSKNELVREVDEFKAEFQDWYNVTKNSWPGWLNDKEKEHKTAQGGYQTEFNEYIEQCKDNISTLEKTYEELLRLAKPADYWNKAAKKFKLQGLLWSLTLVASIAVGLLYFSDFFSLWLIGKESDVNLGSVQGVIIFGTLVAVYAYLVRVLSRITFSAFHLMRDAEEREQLTYLYLSLINNKAADEKSRDIVFQALFSRAETGLLASESGPTMPVISEIIKATTNR